MRGSDRGDEVIIRRFETRADRRSHASRFLRDKPQLEETYLWLCQVSRALNLCSVEGVPQYHSVWNSIEDTCADVHPLHAYKTHLLIYD